MQNIGFNTARIRRSLFAVTAMAMLNTASAGVLSGGTFNVTFDNPENLLEGLTIGPGGLTEYYVANFFDKPLADAYATTTEMTSFATDTYPAPATLQYVVNPSSLAGSGIPLGSGGRNNKATSLSWDASQDALTNSSIFNATGAVGLNGVVMTRGSFTGTLLSGDYEFKYVASRNNGINSGWTLYNNVSFTSATYDTRNISVTTDGDNLVFNGELWWSPSTSAFIFGGDGSTTAGRAATFSLVSPAAVPVPAALWLFGSGLLGLMAGARRNFFAA